MSEPKPKPREMHTFRVYIAQVNQCYVQVLAHDKEEAASKGYRK